MNVTEFLKEYFTKSEEQKIRSNIIFISDINAFSYDASISKPYSFELVNTTGPTMLLDGKELLQAGESLIFPRVGSFKRNDIFEIKGQGAALLEGYIREDLELIG